METFIKLIVKFIFNVETCGGFEFVFKNNNDENYNGFEYAMKSDTIMNVYDI